MNRFIPDPPFPEEMYEKPPVRADDEFTEVPEMLALCKAISALTATYAEAVKKFPRLFPPGRPVNAGYMFGFSSHSDALEFATKLAGEALDEIKREKAIATMKLVCPESAAVLWPEPQTKSKEP